MKIENDIKKKKTSTDPTVTECFYYVYVSIQSVHPNSFPSTTICRDIYFLNPIFTNYYYTRPLVMLSYAFIF